MTILFHCHSDGIEVAAIFLVDQGGARHRDTHPQGSFLSWETQASSSPRSSASQGLGSLPIQKTCSPGTHEAQQALRARGTGLGSARLNIPTSATSRMVRDGGQGAWSQAWPRQGKSATCPFAPLPQGHGSWNQPACLEP